MDLFILKWLGLCTSTGCLWCLCYLEQWSRAQWWGFFLNYPNIAVAAIVVLQWDGEEIEVWLNMREYVRQEKQQQQKKPTQLLVLNLKHCGSGFPDSCTPNSCHSPCPKHLHFSLQPAAFSGLCGLVSGVTQHLKGCFMFFGVLKAWFLNKNLEQRHLKFLDPGKIYVFRYWAVYSYESWLISGQLIAWEMLW